MADTSASGNDGLMKRDAAKWNDGLKKMDAKIRKEVETGDINFTYPKGSHKFYGKTITLVSGSIPRTELEKWAIVDLTEIFFPSGGKTIWDYVPDGTHREKVAAFLEGNPDVMTMFLAPETYFISPIDGAKLRSTGGRRKKGVWYDVPNLAFAITAWLLENRIHDTVFVDPWSWLVKKDTMVGVDNLSAFMRFLKESNSDAGITKMDQKDGQDYTFILRANGEATPKQVRAMEKILTNLFKHTVHLSEPKYGSDGKVNPDCFASLHHSVAKLTYNLMLFPDFLSRQGFKVRSLNLILDEFTGYALYMAAAVYALGYQDFTNILCWRNGLYTLMPAKASDAQKQTQMRPELETD